MFLMAEFNVVCQAVMEGPGLVPFVTVRRVWGIAKAK